VIVTAVPDPGWAFDAWSDGLAGTENPDTLVMVSDTTITAAFTQEQYALTVEISGPGSVTIAPDQPSYLYGDTVIVTAIPDPGSIHIGWWDGLAVTGTENPDTIVMVSDTTITALFTEEHYTLVTKALFSGSVETSPDQPMYLFGDSVIVTAIPDSGWVFDSWSQGLAGSENPDTLVMESDTTVTAVFQKIVSGVEDMVPKTFSLYQNFPNPFNPVTRIQFDLPRSTHVRLSIYNVKGELVATVINKDMDRGRYEILWAGVDDRGKAVSSGVYFYRIAAGTFVQTRKMLVIK
jgi:hypothetical protein